MTNLSNNFPNPEDDPCTGCTNDDCTHCNYQSDIDRMLDVFPYNDDFNETIKGCDPGEPLPEPAKPRRAPKPITLPPQHLEPPPDPVEPDPSSAASPPPSEPPPEQPKRKPGAPKGNLNALKHGIYISGQSVRNTTPMERAKLGDLNDLIEHVKTYIEKVYQNGLTLKTTEEMNDTLKKITSASIALTRLLHTHDALMHSSIPYSMSGETRAQTIKLLSYYQKQQDLYSELTNPDPEPNQDENNVGEVINNSQ